MDKTIFSEEYEIFLSMLRSARLSAQMTQEELARRLNETQSWVSRCERGERRLDIIEARAFCEALGISFPELAERLHRALRERPPRI